MNCKTSAMLGFLTGIALGGIATWYYSKEKYTFIAEQEIASVKEAYSKREQPATEQAERIPSPKASLRRPARKLKERTQVPPPQWAESTHWKL